MPPRRRVERDATRLNLRVLQDVTCRTDTIVGMDDEMGVANAPDEDWDEGPGLEERIGRRPWLRVLLRLALLSGLAWILSNAALQIRLAVVTGSVFGSEGEAEFYEWVQVVSSICYTLFVVSVGSYVLLWLATRRREEL